MAFAGNRWGDFADVLRNDDTVERRLILVLLAVMAAIVLLAPRINLWLLADACFAQHGYWDAGDRRCYPDRRH